MNRPLDVLFIHPGESQAIYQGLSRDVSAIETPTWCLLLAEACRSKGYGVGILDCDAERLTPEQAVSKILEIKPKIACFVVYGSNPNAGTTKMTGAVAVASLLKSTSDIKTCFIGSHVSACPQQVAAMPFVDYVCLNDGLYSLWYLLGEQGLYQPKILTFPPVSQSNMNVDLPGMAWDLLPYREKPFDLYRSCNWHADFDEDKRKPYAALYTSLGCPYACLAGDTPIDTIYGSIPIKELAAKYKTVPVYTYDPDTREVFISDAKAIRRYGRNEQMVRVHFDDGTHIDCTPDHKFIQFKWSNGRPPGKPSKQWFCEAQNLPNGAHVRALKMDPSNGYINVRWERRKVKRRNRMVMEYLMGKELVGGYVHHKDHNRSNDHPDNLQYCETAAEHVALHPEMSERMRNNNPTKNGMSKEWRAKITAAVKGKRRTLEQRLRYRRSKLGKNNPNYLDGHSVGQSSRVWKEVNHRVVRVEWLKEKGDVYCLTVSTGWFFANHVVVKNCDFCMINIINRFNVLPNISAADSRGMRFWSKEWVMRQMDKLSDYGVTTIRISDEMFFLDKRHYVPLLKEIAGRYYSSDLHMWAYARVDTVKEDQLDLFRGAGIKWLALGIEAANQTIRKEISKGSYEEVDIRDIVRKIRDHGINVIANYIFGLPTDTIESMTETFKLSMELCTEMANFYPCFALPGSPLYQQAILKGWKLPDSFEGWSFHSYESEPLATETVPAWEVLQYRDEAWKAYFTNPKFLGLIGSKFGENARSYVEQLTKIELKRRLIHG